MNRAASPFFKVVTPLVREISTGYDWTKAVKILRLCSFDCTNDNTIVTVSGKLLVIGACPIQT